MKARQPEEQRPWSPTTRRRQKWSKLSEAVNKRYRKWLYYRCLAQFELRWELKKTLQKGRARRQIAQPCFIPSKSNRCLIFSNCRPRRRCRSVASRISNQSRRSRSPRTPGYCRSHWTPSRSPQTYY